MRSRAQLIESLERYRQERRARSNREFVLSERVMMAWIFHDNLLEGRTFKPHEIQAALHCQDHSMPSYLRPLLEDIRSYQNAIEMICTWSEEGLRTFCRENFDNLHRHLMNSEPKEAAKVRKSTPVHRDYHQEICSPREIEPRLKALIEESLECDVDVEDVLACAARLHHQLMFIYPFRRQPGTLARLFTNLFLMIHDYPPLILASHERGAYYDAIAAHDHLPLTQLFYQGAWRYLDSAANQQGARRKQRSNAV